MVTQLKNLDDTIVAIATPLGQGAVGMIRLSGKEAITIADRMFVAKNGRRLFEFKSFTVHYGWIVKNVSAHQDASSPERSGVIDEVLLMLMRSPKSYTKEDMVEISCHGGIVSLQSALSLAVDLGARLAEPGEFTQRAFLNGRIDLTQAEAVLDIIQSKTDSFLRVSTHQLKGELSTKLESIREQLMQAYVEMEAVINFPEDEIDMHGRENFIAHIEESQKEVEGLLATAHAGRILKEGIKIVFCGKTNVGKSSLLNVLLKTPRAIVSDIAGTTRDTIEETTQIKGIPFHLVDTAGILEPRDFIEEEAVKRSRMSVKGADLVLLVLDASQPVSREDEHLMKGLNGQNVLVALNKCDLPMQTGQEDISRKKIFQKIVKVSALQKTGIEELENTIVDFAWQEKTTAAEGVLISNLRHIEALKKCQEALLRARSAILESSLEFASEEIKTAVNCLDQITGRCVDADLLDSIFSRFCIGK